MAKEDTKAVSQSSETLTLSLDDLKQLLATVVQEAKRPYVDPKEEQRKEQEREELRKQIRLINENRSRMQAACSHMREDNTCRIAWHQNSDGVWRGVCQACFAWFEPGHPQYEEMIKRPTRASSIFYY